MTKRSREMLRQNMHNRRDSLKVKNLILTFLLTKTKSYCQLNSLALIILTKQPKITFANLHPMFNNY